MGQKVSPVGLRIGINKDWESKWYANDKDFAKYLQNDNQIRKFLLKEIKKEQKYLYTPLNLVLSLDKKEQK